MIFGFPVLATRICKWFEPRSTKIVNGVQGAAKRGFGDSNEFNLKGAAALVTKCAGMGQQGVGVGGSTGVEVGGKMCFFGPKIWIFGAKSQFFV